MLVRYASQDSGSTVSDGPEAFPALTQPFFLKREGSLVRLSITVLARWKWASTCACA